MCGSMRQSAELLDPLYARLKQFVLSSKVVGTDDTPVKVLDRRLARATRKGRFWPYLGDRNHGAAVFDYMPTRERAGPEMFLKGYRGFLQADATGIGGGRLLDAHAPAFSSGARSRPGAHGSGVGLHCAVICGREAGAAVGR